MTEFSTYGYYSFLTEKNGFGDEFIIARCAVPLNLEGSKDAMVLTAIRKETFIEAYNKWIVPTLEDKTTDDCAEWVLEPIEMDDYDSYHCSKCGYTRCITKGYTPLECGWNYCNYCGTKMKESEK